ncbi:hypothetical protein P7C70_g2145, partial [Phenoliferia sp. Uapishka_3]
MYSCHYSKPLQSRLNYPSILTQASIPLDYDSFDAHRSALEQRALTMKQQERRAAEAAALRQRHQQIELEHRREQQEALVEALVQRHLDEQEVVARRQREQARAIALWRQEEAKRRDLEEYLLVRAEVERRRNAARAAQVDERRLSANAKTAAKAAEEHAKLKQVETRKEQASGKPDERVDPITLLFHFLDANTDSPASSINNPTPAATEPAKTSPPKPAEPSEALAAAATLQRHFRAHIARRTALSTLDSLTTSFVTQKSTFTIPSTLKFKSSSTPSVSEHENATSPSQPAPAPQLAYSPSNATFLAYEDFLTTLLTMIDAISSGGDRTVRRARKDLVRNIEKELKELDDARVEQWEQTQEDAAAEPQASQTEVDFSASKCLLYSSFHVILTFLLLLAASNFPSLANEEIATVHRKDFSGPNLKLTTDFVVPSSTIDDLLAPPLEHTPVVEKQAAHSSVIGPTPDIAPSTFTSPLEPPLPNEHLPIHPRPVTPSFEPFATVAVVSVGDNASEDRASDTQESISFPGALAETELELGRENEGKSGEQKDSDFDELDASEASESEEHEFVVV